MTLKSTLKTVLGNNIADDVLDGMTTNPKFLDSFKKFNFNTQNIDDFK